LICHPIRSTTEPASRRRYRDGIGHIPPCSRRNGPGDSILALAGGRLARRRPLSASRQNGSHQTSASHHRQRKRRSSNQDDGSWPIPCPWFSTAVRSAATLAENARPSTSAPRESPTGSSPRMPIPVDSCPPQGTRCSATFPGAHLQTRYYCIPSDRGIGMIRTLVSIFFIIPDQSQLRSPPLNTGTYSKSARLPPAARWRTESLGWKRRWTFHQRLSMIKEAGQFGQSPATSQSRSPTFQGEVNKRGTK